MTSDTNTTDPIRSILVPTVEHCGEGALERALQLAEQVGATVHVLTVVDTANPFRFDVDEVVNLDRAATQLVDETAEAAAGRDVDVQGAVRRGRPARTILDYAETNAIDMLVVGRTGRGGVVETLLGSTTETLVREAHIPVVVVPAGESSGDDAESDDD